MRRNMLFVAMLAALAVPAGTVAPEQPIIVTGVAVRAEIERILGADNLDTELLDSRAVADALQAIPKGRAPDDFWTAYTAHVRAWNDLAEAEESLEQNAERLASDPAGLNEVVMRAQQAEQRIDTTFDEVERIAIRYGARMPIPPYELRKYT